MVIGSESGPDIVPHLPVTQPDVKMESRAKVEVLQGTSSLPAECRRRGLALLLHRYISPLIIDVLAPQAEPRSCSPRTRRLTSFSGSQSALLAAFM